MILSSVARISCASWFRSRAWFGFFSSFLFLCPATVLPVRWPIIPSFRNSFPFPVFGLCPSYIVFRPRVLKASSSARCTDFNTATGKQQENLGTLSLFLVLQVPRSYRDVAAKTSRIPPWWSKHLAFAAKRGFLVERSFFPPRFHILDFLLHSFSSYTHFLLS